MSILLARSVRAISVAQVYSIPRPVGGLVLLLLGAVIMAGALLPVSLNGVVPALPRMIFNSRKYVSSVGAKLTNSLLPAE